MTAMGRLVKAIAGVGAAGYLALPAPLPLPTPSLPPAPLATPSLPVALPTGLPTDLPVATPSAPSLGTPVTRPAASATPVQNTAGGGSRGGTVSGVSSQAPSRGVPIPFTAIYISSPLDVALLGALVTLPLLLAVWLLLAARTFVHARRLREAQVRLLLAADLGLRPKDLTSMSTRALFNLREKSTFDELTGVLRRVAGISLVEREIARARRDSSPLTLAFVDVDGLRDTNERSGRTAGDALLQGMARALREGLRDVDAVIRYGGDEFVCVLPDMAARDARRALGEVQLEATRQGVRFCFGVAELARSDDVVSLLARADRDLYEFKTGRGEIVHLPATTGEGLTSASK